MTKAFQLRVGVLGLALLAGLSACAKNAPATQEPSVIPIEGSPSSATAADDSEYDELFDDPFEFGEEFEPNDPVTHPQAQGVIEDQRPGDS